MRSGQRTAGGGERDARRHQRCADAGDDLGRHVTRRQRLRRRMIAEPPMAAAPPAVSRAPSAVSAEVPDSSLPEPVSTVDGVGLLGSVEVAVEVGEDQRVVGRRVDLPLNDPEGEIEGVSDRSEYLRNASQ